MSRLDDYFRDLKEDGTLDSSGVFTLDPDKVEWKLACYQLASPGLYPLFLLKAACVVKAPYFRVDYDRALFSARARASFLIPGLEVSETQLKAATLGNGKSSEEVGYLAVALTAARRLGKVRLLSRGLNLTVDGDEVHFEPASDEIPTETLFEVSGEQVDQPHGLLKERGRWSPVPISFLGDSHGTLSASEVSSETLTLALGPDTYESALGSAVLWGRVIEMKEAVDLRVLSWNSGPVGKSYGVHRGVAHEVSFDLPDAFQVIICCDDLKMDISYNSFVQNVALEKKKARVRDLIGLLLEEVTSWDVSWSEEDIAEIGAHIKRFWPKESGSHRLTNFYEQTITEHFPFEPIGYEYMLDWIGSLNLQGQEERCLPMYRQEIIDTRSYYAPTAARWSKEEVEFRRALGADWKEADTVRRLIDYLFFHKKSNWNKWRCHPFLGLLDSLMEKDDISQERVDELDLIHPSWMLPLKLHYSRSEVDGFEVFRLLRLLDEGRLKEAIDLAESSTKAPFVPFRRCWYQLILDFYRGELTWGQYIRLRARASFASDPERALLKRRDYMQPDVFEDWAVYHGVFEHGFWFVSAYYTCSCWRSGVSPHRLWCKTLLQAAIGYPGKEGAIAENLLLPLRLPLLSTRR